MTTFDKAIACIQKEPQTVGMSTSNHLPHMGNTTESQKDLECGFLQLPGEIRNPIYGYLLIDCEIRIKMSETSSGARWKGILRFSYTNTHMNYLQINQQIRIEVFSYMLYHCQFNIHYWSLHSFRHFYSDPRIKFIKNMTIHMPNNYVKNAHIDTHCGLVTRTHDLMPIVDALLPLCKAGSLQRVVVENDPRTRIRPSRHRAPGAIDCYMTRIAIAERLRVELGPCVIGREIQFEASGGY